MTKRAKREIETEQYATMMLRMLRGYRRRVADMDIASLRGMSEFVADAERVLGETVAELRTVEGGSYSWAQIGKELGITRATAQQRFAKYCTTSGRVVGGQPSNLR